MNRTHIHTQCSHFFDSNIAIVSENLLNSIHFLTLYFDPAGTFLTHSNTSTSSTNNNKWKLFCFVWQKKVSFPFSCAVSSLCVRLRVSTKCVLVLCAFAWSMILRIRYIWFYGRRSLLYNTYFIVENVVMGATEILNMVASCIAIFNFFNFCCPFFSNLRFDRSTHTSTHYLLEICITSI